MPRPFAGTSRPIGSWALVLLVPLLLQVLPHATPAAATTCAPTRTSFVGDGTVGDAGAKYWVLTFTEVGSCDWTVPDGVTEADVLIVAGGGGGGANVGGGGGAGGMLELTGADRVPVTPNQLITVVVGEGGSGATHTSGGAQRGGNSSFGSSTAVGGGNGASWTIQVAMTGGSGGGGSQVAGSSYPGQSGTSGQGDAGGNAWRDSQPHPAGGGGGAGGRGGDGTGSAAGDGGVGRASTITGTSVTYAGGGGGGWHGPEAGSAGSGGGGGGGAGGDNVNGSDGAANTGGGGGGTGRDAADSATSGGSGGSGVVIVRVRSVATELGILTEPISGVPTGGPLSVQPVVHVLDGFGELVADAAVEVTATIASGSDGVLGGTTTVTAVNGVATFTNLTLAGDPDVDHVLAFSATGLVDATSQATRVLPAVPTSLVLVAEPVSGVPTGGWLPVQPAVHVLDGFGQRIVDGSTTTVSVAVASGSDGVLGGTTTVTAVNGVVTFTDLTLAGDPDVDYVLAFSATGLVGATSQAIRVLPAIITLATACAPVPPRVGDEVVCTVTGGDPGIEILWRVAFNPVVAEGPVTLDAQGSGTFGFTVPATAVGRALSVELVAWTAPQSLGVVGGPGPTSVPSGEGPRLPFTGGGFAFAVVLVVAALMSRRRAGAAR